MAIHLKPDKYRQGDLFIADIFDAGPRGDQASMEHPLFALRAGDRQIRHYERNGNVVEVQPGALGLATQHDKDILIYCISQLVAAINDDRPIARTVQLRAYELLVATNRRTDGDAYQRLQVALDRLRGTTISTNIKTGGQRERAGFGLIDSYRIVERDGQERMAALEVTLSEWTYRAVESMQVLSLSRDYFRLRKPIDRRVYELARKHCGGQPKWRVRMYVLHEKSGSRAPLKKFRYQLRALAESDELPDYRLAYDGADDTITFYGRGAKGGRAQLADLRRSLGKKR